MSARWGWVATPPPDPDLPAGPLGLSLLCCLAESLGWDPCLRNEQMPGVEVDTADLALLRAVASEVGERGAADLLPMIEAVERFGCVTVTVDR